MQLQIPGKVIVYTTDLAIDGCDFGKKFSTKFINCKTEEQKEEVGDEEQEVERAVLVIRPLLTNVIMKYIFFSFRFSCPSVNHSPPFNAQIKNGWSYNSTYP